MTIEIIHTQTDEHYLTLYDEHDAALRSWDRDGDECDPVHGERLATLATVANPDDADALIPGLLDQIECE